MKKLGLSLGSILFTLIAVEIVLRWTGLGMIRPEFQFDRLTAAGLKSGNLVVDADLFWREPEDPATAGSRPGRFIRVGDPVPAKGRKFRVITLGDSCTRLSENGRFYSVVLEHMLDPRRAEVFNASLPGYTSHQGLAWLKKQLLAYQPDLVTIYFGWNDHWRSTGISDSEYAARLAPGQPRLLNLLAGKTSPAPVRVSEQEYGSNLREMARLLTAAGVECWFILAPHSFTADNTAHFLEHGNIIAGDDPREMHLSYLEVARQVAGAKVVDLAAVFETMNADRVLLMRDGIHPTDPGHGVIARVLADKIMKQAFRRPGPMPEEVVSGLTEMAKQLSVKGEHAAAVDAYRRAVARDPGFLKARLGLSWLLATEDAVRDGKAARAVLDPAREAEASAPDFLFIAAGAEAACGDYEGAVGLLDRALEVMKEQGQAGSGFAETVRGAREKYRAGKAP